ncbi:MAG: flavin prenyltransferase UbiX [Pseudomonadota bacterium]
MNAQRVFLGITGASGLVYAERLLECLLGAGRRVELCVSRAAHQVAALEMGESWPSRPAELKAFFLERLPESSGRLTVYGREDWLAPAASGSNPPDAVVICPCTTGTLAAIAQGLGDSLIERAADVAIKERRDLILVPREAPFSAIHLEHMLALARLGAVILPPNPGFYHRPQTIQDLVDFVVARILDHLGVPHALMARWGDDA